MIHSLRNVRTPRLLRWLLPLLLATGLTMWYSGLLLLHPGTLPVAFAASLGNGDGLQFPSQQAGGLQLPRQSAGSTHSPWSCVGQACTGKDPIQMGCNTDAKTTFTNPMVYEGPTLTTSQQTIKHSQVVGWIQRRHSDHCQANWARTVGIIGTHVAVNANQSEGWTNPGDTTSAYSNMVADGDPAVFQSTVYLGFFLKGENQEAFTTEQIA